MKVLYRIGAVASVLLVVTSVARTVIGLATGDPIAVLWLAATFVFARNVEEYTEEADNA